MTAPLGFTAVRPVRQHAYGAVVEDGAWAVIDTTGSARLVTRHATKREWNDYAVHPKLGKLSVHVMAVFNYSHSLEHLAQLIDIYEKTLLKHLNQG